MLRSPKPQKITGTSLTSRDQRPGEVFIVLTVREFLQDTYWGGQWGDIELEYSRPYTTRRAATRCMNAALSYGEEIQDLIRTESIILVSKLDFTPGQV